MKRYIPIRRRSIEICKILQLIPICYLTVHPQNSTRPSPALMQINRAGKPALRTGASSLDQLVGPLVAR